MDNSNKVNECIKMANYTLLMTDLYLNDFSNTKTQYNNNKTTIKNCLKIVTNYDDSKDKSKKIDGFLTGIIINKK